MGLRRGLQDLTTMKYKIWENLKKYLVTVSKEKAE